MKNKIFGNKFWYGASCAPYAKSMDWPMEQWGGDLANMKAMGFSIARIFIPWDRIERKEGTLDFSRQDHFMDMAAKHGIGVILNVGGVFDNLQGIYPPSWLTRKYCVNAPQPDPRRPESHRGPRVRVCLDDPIYREKAFAFIALAARRYSKHPATAGWMVWNEPWLKNCYCPATVKRFCAWIEDKYDGDLDELNRLWGSEFPIDYETWGEVEPPAGAGFLGGGLNAWRDWHEFNEFRLTDAMIETNRAIKANDPENHPTTSNHVCSRYLDSNFSNIRISAARDATDIMGFSYYTLAHGEGQWMTPFRKSLHVAFYRWFSPEAERRTLALETEAGPNLFMITENQRRLNNWLAVGHNAKSMICWNYRSRYSDNQVGNFNMMAWDGSPTGRAGHHAAMAEMFNRHAGLINNCFPERQAAVLMPDCLSLMAMTTHCGLESGQCEVGNYGKLVDGRLGAFKLLWDMNIVFDGLNECNLSEIGRYKVVLLPMIENMSPSIAAALKGYVAQGGTLIAESPFAFKDENNFLHGRAPIYGLDEVFGAFTRDREGKESAPLIVYPDGAKARVCFLWHVYEPTTAEVTATYEDGRAAIVTNRFGKGRAILCGTEVFRQYMTEPEEAAAAFLHQSALDSGARRAAEVVIDGKTAEGSGVEVCRLGGKPGIIYIVLNHNKTPVSFRLKIRESNGGWFNMETGDTVSLGDEINLPAEGALAFARKA